MGKILLDTDVLIDHLRGHRPLPEADAAISVVTRAELFAGDERQEARVEALFGECEELEVSPSIARTAGRLKRHAKLQIADALIAATALENDLPLMTRNERHFGRVPDLDLRVPEA